MGLKVQNTTYIDTAIRVDRESNILSSAYPLIEVVRPQWDRKSMSHEIFNDGLTNKVICVWQDGKIADKILIRIYGQKTDLIIDRVSEMMCMDLLYNNDLAPPLYCSFSNGLIYGYANGIVLNVDTVRDSSIAQLVARKMAQVHSVEMPTVRGVDTFDKDKPALFRLLAKFTANLDERFSNPEDQRRFELEFGGVSSVESEVRFVKEHFEALDLPIVFCHNDLLLKNIVFDSVKGDVTFIDFEYAGANFQCFDIANHFVEFAGTDDVDYSRLPDQEFKRRWISTYLATYNDLISKPAPASSDIDNLLREVDLAYLAAHLFWSVWSVVQAQNSSIDFDYWSYGILRIREYYRLKKYLEPN